MYFRSARQQRQRGVISVLAAVALGVAIAVAALALDLGHVFWVKRDLQKAADLSSLSALTNLNQASAIAQQIAKENNFDSAAEDNSLTVTVGVYDWTNRIFAPGGAAALINAVQVTAGTSVPYHFMRGDTGVTATAIAARKEPTAAFTADSFLANIDPVIHAKLLESGAPVVDLPISLPGIADVTLQVIEPPVSPPPGPARCIDPANCSSSVIGDWETRASTAQLRLGLKMPLGVDVKIEAAKMDAALTKIDCRSSPRSVTILAQPGVLGVSINGVHVVSSPPSTSKELTFTFTDPPPQTQPVSAAGLGSILPVLGPLDGALASLGISLGGGNITVSQLNCFPPQLVH